MSAISDIFSGRHGFAIPGQAGRRMAWLGTAWLPRFFRERRGTATQSKAVPGVATPASGRQGVAPRGLAWLYSIFAAMHATAGCGEAWLPIAGQRVAWLRTAWRGLVLNFPTATRGLAGCGEARATRGIVRAGLAWRGLVWEQIFSVRNRVAMSAQAGLSWVWHGEVWWVELFFVDRSGIARHSKPMPGGARLGTAWPFQARRGYVWQSDAGHGVVSQGVAWSAEESIFEARNGGAVQRKAGLGTASSGWPWSGAARNRMAWLLSIFSAWRSLAIHGPASCGPGRQGLARQCGATRAKAWHGLNSIFGAAVSGEGCQGTASSGEACPREAGRPNARQGNARPGTSWRRSAGQCEARQGHQQFSRRADAWLGAAAQGCARRGIPGRGMSSRGMVRISTQNNQ